MAGKRRKIRCEDCGSKYRLVIDQCLEGCCDDKIVCRKCLFDYLV